MCMQVLACGINTIYHEQVNQFYLNSQLLDAHFQLIWFWINYWLLQLTKNKIVYTFSHPRWQIVRDNVLKLKGLSNISLCFRMLPLTFGINCDCLLAKYIMNEWKVLNEILRNQLPGLLLLINVWSKTYWRRLSQQTHFLKHKISYTLVNLTNCVLKCSLLVENQNTLKLESSWINVDGNCLFIINLLLIMNINFNNANYQYNIYNY